MNKSEQEVIRNVIKRISGEAGTTAEYVQDRLTDPRVRLYLKTWVVGALECLLPESRDLELAKVLSGRGDGRPL